MRELCDDLAAEHDSLDGLVASLDDDAWDTPTPAEGWTVRDQISHLAFFDRQALTAVLDPDRFKAEMEQAISDPAGYDRLSVDEGRAMKPGEVLASWRKGWRELLDVLRGLDLKTRIFWYGRAMGARSFATARLMETWAHGQDVVDALRVEREATDRLRHVAMLGVMTRPHSYTVRGRRPPETPVRVELTGPGGEQWSWGDEDAADRVDGDALEFCLVVTQRRHVADTRLAIKGRAASEWMQMAQAYAGPAGPGRQPGSF